MPSVVPGYTYDIFISYRQKDNKYDGWVTEFVLNLKKELEATLKDDISIYFDENPHDGLLEVNDVDESLRSKLRSVVLIPIVSQTYCDPRSFAWKNEFLVFKQIASSDALGLKVTLPNGNVTSRILPVRIHELEDADRTAIEHEIGPLRAIDFIYTERGVNRPLRPSDAKGDNLTKTDYRNQVNKVANAVKEIISGIQHKKVGGSTENRSQQDTTKPGSLRKYGLVGLASVAVLAIAYYLLAGTLSPKNTSDYQYDVAVMYMENLTDDDKYADGLVNLIHINLSEDTSLRVTPRHKLYEKLREISPGSNVPDQAVATELASSIGARFMITGRIIQQEDEVVAQVELIDVSSGRVAASKKVRGKKDQIFALADGITGQLMEGRVPERTYDVQKISTGNYDAYKEFYNGLESFWQLEFSKASDSFGNAIQLDSTFATAYVYKAIADNPYASFNYYRDPMIGEDLIKKAMANSVRLPRKEQLMARLAYEGFHFDPDASETLQELYALDPDDKLTVFQFQVFHNHEESIRACEDFIRRNPTQTDMYNNLAYLYQSAKMREKAKNAIDLYVLHNRSVYNGTHSGWEIYTCLGDNEVAMKFALEMIDKFPTVKGRSVWKGMTELYQYRPLDAFETYQAWKDSASGRELPLLGVNALLMQGKTGAALRSLEEEINKSQRAGDLETQFYLRLHKPLIYLTANQLEKADEELNKIIIDSRGKFNYNPFPFLGHYYKGLVALEKGNITAARKAINELNELLGNKGYDLRFQQFLVLLTAETELAAGNAKLATTSLESLPRWQKVSNPRCFIIQARILLNQGKNQEALDFANDVSYYARSARQVYGGNSILYTIDLIYAPYYKGLAYEGIGNRAEAIKSYTFLLDLMKGAEVKPPLLEDASKRLAALKK